MSWDSTNCVLALAPNPWSKGNGTSDQNVGNMPSYPAGAFQNCVLTNMAAGFGYVYNAGDGYLNFDGLNDFIQTQKPISLSPTVDIAWEIWFVYNATGNAQAIWANYDDAQNYMLSYIIGTDDTVVIAPEIANVIKTCRTSTALTDGVLYHLVIGYNSGTPEVFINGVEASYAGGKQESLAATKTFTDKGRLGAWNANLPLLSNVHWFAVYDAAFTAARAAQNYALGKDMGLIGTNTGSSMALDSSAVNHLSRPGSGRGRIR